MLCLIIGKLEWAQEVFIPSTKKNIIVEWRYHYAALLEYYKEHGTCNVPKRSSYECDIPDMGDDGAVYHYKGNLGSWLDYQRKANRSTGLHRISPERVAQLQLLVDEGIYLLMIRILKNLILFLLFASSYHNKVNCCGRLQTPSSKKRRVKVLLTGLVTIQHCFSITRRMVLAIFQQLIFTNVICQIWVTMVVIITTKVI